MIIVSDRAEFGSDGSDGEGIQSFAVPPEGGGINLGHSTGW